MKILMMTNTYLPHVGGVARSVSGLAQGLSRRGHEVLVVAPEFPKMRSDETASPSPQVLRVTALQQFGGSDFSMPLPLTWPMSEAIDRFDPDLVHSHHPFLLGDTALRVSADHQVPIVFTYHTRYELYGHYVADDSELLKRLIQSLAHGYCDMCDHVIAPSASIAEHLNDNDVDAPISVIPTGIDVGDFASGQRARGRRSCGLRDDSFVVGHVGRLAPEKNLDYLTDALAGFLKRRPEASVLIVGDGGARQAMQAALTNIAGPQRVRFTGVLTGQDLWDAYACQDVFAFSSHSETQGLVLAEAMASGLPVVALDAPGAREIVRDGENGRLLAGDADSAAFIDALDGLAAMKAGDRARLSACARETAALFSTDACLDRIIDTYLHLHRTGGPTPDDEDSIWMTAKRRLALEFDIVSNIANAVTEAVLTEDDDDVAETERA